MRWCWSFGLLALLLWGCESAGVTPRDVETELSLLDTQQQLAVLRREGSVGRIGSAAKLVGMEPAAAGWCSLVVGLGENGTDASEVRDVQIETDVKLWNELLKRCYVSGIVSESGGRASTIVSSRDSAPVSVATFVPPLAQPNDRLDVWLEAMGNTKSLRGGLLIATPLRQVLGPMKYGGPWAEARGKVTLSSGRLAFGESTAVRETVAYVPAGATCYATGFLGLRLRQPSAYSTRLIAMVLSEHFAGSALALGSQAVRVVVPDYYRDEWRRFARVIQEVRCDLVPGRQLSSYVNDLTRDLRGDDPVVAEEAALKLEAVGPEAVPALEQCLRSSQPAVRRAAACTLAAMREPAGIGPLTHIIDTSSIDSDRRLAARFLNFYTQSNVREYQKTLLSDRDLEVRYRALVGLERTQEDAPYASHETAQGEDFRVSRVRTSAPAALVIKARSPRRLVFFGDSQPLLPPFKQAQLGDLALEAVDDTQVTVYYRVYGQPNRLPIRSLELVDLVRGLDSINVTINDIMDLIFKLSRADAITGEVLFLDE